MSYQINFNYKMAEQDVYEDGCQPDTAIHIATDIDFKAETLSDLIEQIKDSFGIKTDSMLFNACEELGRLDVQIYEDSEGYNIDSELGDDETLIGKAWREGKTRVWLATYSGYVQEAKDVDLKQYTEAN